MITTISVVGACVLLVLGAAYNLSKQDDTNLERIVGELNFIKGQYTKLQKQVNEMNSGLYDARKELTDHIALTKTSFESERKKINELEFHVMKPRAINVTMMKPIEIKTPEALKFIGGVRTKRVSSPRVKTVSKKKAPLKKTSKKKSLRKSKNK